VRRSYGEGLRGGTTGVTATEKNAPARRHVITHNRHTLESRCSLGGRGELH